jgi:hypothetical protein
MKRVSPAVHGARARRDRRGNLAPERAMSDASRTEPKTLGVLIFYAAVIYLLVAGVALAIFSKPR